MLRWTLVGTLFVLWFAVLARPSAVPGAGDRYAHSSPRLALPMDEDYRPYDIIGMMNGQAVELAQGYHKRAFVYVGKQAVLTTFDTGSFRNAIQAEYLKELEKKQKVWRVGYS